MRLSAAHAPPAPSRSLVPCTPLAAAGCAAHASAGNATAGFNGRRHDGAITIAIAPPDQLPHRHLDVLAAQRFCQLTCHTPDKNVLMRMNSAQGV